MKQSEFKKRYDPELGRFTRQHIYGEGVMDTVSKVFGQTLKKAAKTAATKAVTTAATKTGEHFGEKAGDKRRVFFTGHIPQVTSTGHYIFKS